MKERIILAPGVSETEMLRTLAKSGVNTMGWRFMNAAQLAKTALMKSGITIEETFLTSKEEPALIFSFLNEIPYFEAASFADAEALSSALQTLRSLITENESTVLEEKLSCGEFKDKNDALISVYEKYISLLHSAGKIDNIGLIRRAIDASKPFDAEFVMLKEFPLTPLEEHLLSFLSQGGYKVMTMTELFNGDAKPVSISGYTESYGEINEVLHILTEIYDNRIPLDECTVACTNPGKYGQIFFDLSRQYDIPITYGNGIPITNTKPAELLKLLHNWDAFGQHGIDSLKSILLSDAFDRKALFALLGLEDEPSSIILMKIAETAGSLRISFDKNENERRIRAFRKSLQENAQEEELEILGYAEKLSRALEEGWASFIEKFALIRPEPSGRIDRSAIMVITEFLSAYNEYADADSIKDIIPKLLEKTVSSEISREGALHIASIFGAPSSLRKNLFVCGLSSSEFPGNPKENYILLDSDLLLLGDENKVPTSDNKISNKKEAFFNLLELASAIGVKINLSYSGYDLSTLKDCNPSSVLFTCFEKEHPGASTDDFKKSIVPFSYFEDKITSTRQIGEAYTKGLALDVTPICVDMPDSASLLEKSWSPSALDVFFQCPRRFYLTRVIGIPDDEEDDPFAVIDSGSLGSLAHKMMESLASDEMTEEAFLALCEKAFDDFLAGRPPIHEHDAEKEKREFLKMMQTACKTDPGNEVISAENEYSFTHPCGVRIKGLIDRVEKEPDGTFIVADYKTKRKIEHEKDDINTCLQVVIYAWLCEQAGVPVRRCDYRYIRKGKTISCSYDDLRRTELKEKLEAFKEALTTNTFPRNPGKSDENCRYCTMNDICFWDEEAEGKEEI